MNLSVLERMIREGDLSLDSLRYLLNCKCECEWLDYKQILRLENDKELCDFAKDILAMKNVGGGYIVVGVEDKTWKPLGLATNLPYDSKLLRDKLRRSSGADLDVDIVHHDLHLPPFSGKFALVFVRSSKKRSKRRMPTLVGVDFLPTQPYGLKRGEIYVRKGDSTVRVHSSEELAELLDVLEAQADHDALAAEQTVSPFAVEDGTYRILERGFDAFVGREGLRHDILSAVNRDPRIWIVNVHGPGGVGKSALVNWVAYEFYQQRTFEAILHLTAKETVLTAQGIVRATRSLYSLENLLDQILNLFQETSPQSLEEKRALAIECLSAWNTLLILDNMETLNDARVMSFIQSLPPTTKAKVLLTSRQKTGGWELPFPVNELSVAEVAEFVRIRSAEMGVTCPVGPTTAEKFWRASGGLPLAIQWILGRYKLVGNLDPAIDEVARRDSPVLEFSFGNTWKVLSPDAKAILAIMSVFDEPPTLQYLTVAAEFSVERIEKALAELQEVTLVARNTQASDGRTLYIALPITLSFAQNQLQDMGDFELTSRKRLQRFYDQMRLQETELIKFRSRFEQYGLETENEKKAAILCQRGESEMFVGNVTNADMLFKQARELVPQSAYILAMSASYELARNRVGNALTYVEDACGRATKKTGALCYTIKARILDVQRDRDGRVSALEKAIGYAPEDNVVRHQYGVALSRAGRPKEAIGQFSIIVEKEKNKVPPTLQMLMALKTRMINLRRLGRNDDLKQDLATVTDILQRYPHLAAEGENFTEFFDEEKDNEKQDTSGLV